VTIGPRRGSGQRYDPPSQSFREDEWGREHIAPRLLFALQAVFGGSKGAALRDLREAIGPWVPVCGCTVTGARGASVMDFRDDDAEATGAAFPDE